MSELRYILVGSKKEEFVEKNRNTYSRLDNLVLGGFLTLLAVLMALFAGAMGVMAVTPIVGIYSGALCKKIFIGAIIFSLLIATTYILKFFFGFENWQIFGIFCLFIVSFVAMRKITKTQN